MTVNEFVKTKGQPEFRPIVAAVRGLISEYAPDAREAISYGMPTYGQNKPVAWINSSKSGITLGFATKSDPARTRIVECSGCCSLLRVAPATSFHWFRSLARPKT